MYKKRTSNNLIFINPNLEQDAQASVPDFLLFFCLFIFSHAKVHDSFYLKWKMRLINYSIEIRKAFLTIFLAMVINRKSNPLNSPPDAIHRHRAEFSR